MNTYTRAYIDQALNGKMQGRIGNLISVDNVVNEAVRRVSSEVKPGSLKSNAFVVPFEYGNYYLAPLPVDMLNDSVRGMYDVVDSEQIHFLMTFEQDMDAWGGRTRVAAVVNVNGNRYLKMNFAPQVSGLYVEDLDDYSNWSNFMSASNISDETRNFMYKDKAVRFDMDFDSNTNVQIRNTTTSIGDVSAYIDNGSTIQFYLYIPNAEKTGAVSLSLGSDASNYNTYTTENRFSLVKGWNVVNIPVDNPAVTGTPDMENVDFIQLDISKESDKQAVKGCVFNGFFIGEAKRYRFNYYNDQYWKNDSEDRTKNRSTKSDDYIICEDDFANAVVYQAAIIGSDEADMPQSKINSYQNHLDKIIEMGTPDDCMEIMQPSTYQDIHDTNSRWDSDIYSNSGY